MTSSVAKPAPARSMESDIVDRPRLWSGPPNPLDPATPLLPYRSTLVPAPAHRLLPGLLHELTIGATSISIHPDLPPVPAWGYGLLGHASSPGPQLEVLAGQPSLLRFANRLPAPSPLTAPVALPLVVAKRETDDDPNDSAQNHIGEVGTSRVETNDSPIGWTTVHLHGAHAHSDADGFPDNMQRSGSNQFLAYENTYDNVDLGLDKVGQFLWYHDHAMNSTRYHVYSGLAGAYIVRDPREAQLGLPIGIESGELTLLLQDRNVTRDTDGSLRLLHKTTAETAEFFGPLTLVNDKLWPRIALRPNVYRLRLLNGSNARAYRLHLISYDDGCVTVLHERVLVIGTDGGLLWRAAALPNDAAMTLAPAERIDILLVLTDLSPHAALYLINSAEAPFHGSAVPSLDDLENLVLAGDPGNRNPYPAVARIDIEPASILPGKRKALFDNISKTELNPAFRRLVHTAQTTTEDAAQPPTLSVEDHEHHVILLGENPDGGHLFLQELIAEEHGPITLQLSEDSAPKSYRVATFNVSDDEESTKRIAFYDRTVVRPQLGQWQVWRFVNATGDTHPIHIHQSTFQPLGEQAFLLKVQEGPDADDLTNIYNPITRQATAPLLPDRDPTHAPRRYEAHERLGWKDTIRVDPGNVVTIAIRFDTPGRYVYHCHVIEHEDIEMMRPFVVMVKQMKDGESGMHM